jgi:hypothetical protein
MATLGTTAVTLHDFQRRLGPDDKIAALIELLAEQNEVLDDILWVEGNLQTGHKTTVRTGLPSVTWRLLNYGVQPSKSQTAQVTDSCGMLEAYAQVDKSLADLNGNAAAWRLSEDQAFIEAMNQAFCDTFIAGDTTVYPERFVGLQPRLATPSATKTVSGYNMITGSGSTSNAQTSIYLVVWGANTVHGIYPKGSKAGLSTQDLGEQTLSDAAGGMYQGYRTHYKWDCGLTVRDWRYIVRICNIDVAALVANSSPADLITLMIKALNRVPNLRTGKAAFYCNNTVKTMLAVQAQAAVKAGGQLGYTDVFGRPVLSFQGVPIRRVDSIVDTEAVVSGTFGTP